MSDAGAVLMPSARGFSSAAMRPRRKQGPRRICVQDLLEWAFRVERVQLELPDPRTHEDRGFGFGVEYVLMQRAMLGCHIDGGGSNDPHEDAEVVAAAVAGMPDDLGGLRMAIRVAELARAGLTPDWMPGAVSHCVPVEWRQTRHGERAQTEVYTHDRVLNRGRWRTVERRWCPVRFDPHPGLINGARAAYDHWRAALTHVRDALEAGRMLRQHELEERLPPSQPWTRRGRAIVDVLKKRAALEPFGTGR